MNTRTVIRRLCIGLAGVVALAAVPATYASALRFTGNVHEIAVNEAYRSAQLDSQELERVVGMYGIKSTINLRGADPAADWYIAEVATSAKLNIQHFDFRMSASQSLDATAVADLIALMRPALSGADRTGLAASMYQATISNIPAETAETQLPFRFGHVSIPDLSAAYPMSETWEAFEDTEERRHPEM